MLRMTGAGVGHWVVESDKKQFYRVKGGMSVWRGRGWCEVSRIVMKTKIV